MLNTYCICVSVCGFRACVFFTNEDVQYFTFVSSYRGTFISTNNSIFFDQGKIPYQRYVDVPFSVRNCSEGMTSGWWWKMADCYYGSNLNGVHGRICLQRGCMYMSTLPYNARILRIERMKSSEMKLKAFISTGV